MFLRVGTLLRNPATRRLSHLRCVMPLLKLMSAPPLSPSYSDYTGTGEVAPQCQPPYETCIDEDVNRVLRTNTDQVSRSGGLHQVWCARSVEQQGIEMVEQESATVNLLM